MSRSGLIPVFYPQRDDRRRFRNEVWMSLAGLLAVVALLTRQVSLLVAPLLFLTVFAVALLWKRNAFQGVTYRRIFSPQRAFVGEVVEFTIEIDNRKWLPLGWLCVNDLIPEGLTLLNEEGHFFSETSLNDLYEVFALRWHERLRRRYQIQCHTRGYFRLGPAHFVSGDIFGIFRTEARDLHPDWLIVYPKVYPLEALGLPATDPLGDFKYPQRIFEDPLRTVGVRDYKPGDSLRRVHWKATARRQRLQSRIYEPAASPKLVLFLNIATLDQPWRGTIPEVLERLISVTASLANYAIEERYAVGVIVNSSVPNSSHSIKVPPGRSPQQLTRILEALAATTPVATSSIETLLTEESPRLPLGATLVLVTAAVNESLGATLIHLSRAGRRIVLITLAPSLPDPLLYQRLRVYHLPADRLAFESMALADEEGSGR